MPRRPSRPSMPLVFTLVPEGRLRDVAVVGLGAGALAAYARPGQAWTFYEINPAVVRVATDRHVFSFLADAFDGDGHRPTVVLGDARLRLADVPPASYDVLVVDAFSSDAVPAHLLTREAVEIYRRILRPGGIVAAHVSNRFVDLVPVLAAVAHATGLVAVVRDDRVVPPELLTAGKSPSTWIALVREAENAEPLTRRHSDWVRLTSRPDAPPWTDDYMDLLGALRWF